MTPHGAFGVQRPGHTHAGVDYGAKRGAPVYAPVDGTVLKVEDRQLPPLRGYAPAVVLLERGGKRLHVLAHLEAGSQAVQVGDRVREGQTIAKVGPLLHVHHEVRDKASGRPVEARGLGRGLGAFLVGMAAVGGLAWAAARGRRVLWQ